MNRILFEPAEVKDGVATFGGERAAHVLDVLHGEIGQTLKTGIVHGPIGTSVITEIRREGSVLETSGTGTSWTRLSQSRLDGGVLSVSDAMGTIASTGASVGSGPVITVRCSHDEASVRPWIDLILAPPRPRVMKRLLPQLATLGVGKIVLVGAKKVEKDFWGATLLKPENYRPLLVDGLMQAGTSILPTIELRRNFRKFVREELDTLFPATDRLVAHPYDAPTPVPVHSNNSNNPNNSNNSSPLLAIGPEGGWTDEEVALLEEHGFRRYSLGSRILRTDTATIALLAQLMMRYPS